MPDTTIRKIGSSANEAISFYLSAVLQLQKILIVTAVVSTVVSCAIRPGPVRKLEGHNVHLVKKDTLVKSNGRATGNVQLLYLGSGGVLLIRNGAALLIDPFFSHQRFGRIGRSIFLGKEGARNIKPDQRLIKIGTETIRSALGDSIELKAMLVAHSHYDHLMDVPALSTNFGNEIPILLNQTGYNICHLVLDSSKVSVLEDRMTTGETLKDPFIIPQGDSLSIHIWPILADHNPHFRHVKFFSGERARPIGELDHPLKKTRANLWLEGNTFSFLIDFVKVDGSIDYRIFVQSSSCNPPAGIPPAELLSRPADLAILGVVSSQFSPEYPCAQIDKLAPDEIIWVHWEDFFRKYTRKPKTVRGTDIPGFFKLPCVNEDSTRGTLLWPRTTIEFVY